MAAIEPGHAQESAGTHDICWMTPLSRWTNIVPVSRSPRLRRYTSYCMLRLKPIEFLGSSRKALAKFPAEARRTAGFQLDLVQRGLDPVDWKPFWSAGPGAMELRVRDSAGAFRVVYVAKFDDAVYVLHAFQERGRKTARLDVELARVRYAELLKR